MIGKNRSALWQTNSCISFHSPALVSREGKYLLEEHVLFYCAERIDSLSSLQKTRAGNLRLTNERLLSVGNPAFDREEIRACRICPRRKMKRGRFPEAMRNPFSFWAVKQRNRSFLRNIVDVEVAHFAGHFVANAQAPANSKLLLADVELRSSEFGALKLPRVKLVVLSACETAYERHNRSEGAIGIARTFLALGAPVVVASQWKVESAATRDLMIAFHRGRKHDGMTSAESLRQAQLEVLRRSETSAPFYWAAFSLFGGHAKY